MMKGTVRRSERETERMAVLGRVDAREMTLKAAAAGMPGGLPMRGCGDVDDKKEVFHSSTVLFLLGKGERGRF